MNVVALARSGLGVTGPVPVAMAIARAIAIACIEHADPAAVVVQVAGPEEEVEWVLRRTRVARRARLPPGLDFAVHVANADRSVGRLLVAEREAALGDRPASVIRIGLDSIELDRRDGSVPQTVLPRFTSLEEARGGPA